MRKEQESTITIAPPSRDLSNTASVESQSASVDGIVPFAEVRDYSKDELNKKLAFLKGFEMFRVSCSFGFFNIIFVNFHVKLIPFFLQI